MNFAIGRTLLGDNPTTGAIISGIVAIFSVYGIVKSNFSLENFVYGIGISSEFLTGTLLPIVFILIAVILIFKYTFRRFLVIVFGLFGALMTGLAVFGFLYERAVGFFVGVISLLIALVIHKKFASRAGGAIYDARPAGRFLKSERKIRRKIKKFEKKYQRALKKDDRESVKYFDEQLKSLYQRLNELERKEQKSIRKNVRPVGTGGIKEDSLYQKGMRRGGEKPNRGLSVSKNAVDRYTQRYGKGAGKRRFGVDPNERERREKILKDIRDRRGL